ncbi:MAG: substrate-binding domain-containing protein [Prochloraceae cyanobacterium]
MSKLVVLKLNGEYDKGFLLTLEIGRDGKYSETEITGSLPPATELIKQYEDWQFIYHRLKYSFRLKHRLDDSFKLKQQRKINPLEVHIDDYIQRQRQQCGDRAKRLKEQLNQWLDSRGFQRIDRLLREELNPEEEIRILIRTSSSQLRKLPWHLWNFLELYPFSEIAFSALEYQRPTLSKTPANQVRILAILGNSSGIDVLKDKAELLKNLPNANITFLEEPQRQQLNNELWEQPWDILFFAGHSQTEGESGRIYINQSDSFAIEEIKSGVKKAIEKGLQLAIFNSCDGLGLASELEKLHIPQMIVMREPVPDAVAQKFLTYLLPIFASGAPLHLAVRSARERLQNLEDEFPCASWLPVICQNPALVPPTWSDLLGEKFSQPSASLSSKKIEQVPLLPNKNGNSESKIPITALPSQSTEEFKLTNPLLALQSQSSEKSEHKIPITALPSQSTEELKPTNHLLALQSQSTEKLEHKTPVVALPSQSTEELKPTNPLLALQSQSAAFLDNCHSFISGTASDKSPKLVSALRKNKQKAGLTFLGITTSAIAVLLLLAVVRQTTTTSTISELGGTSQNSSIAFKNKTYSTFREIPSVPSGTFRYGGSTTWAVIRNEIDPVLAAVWPEFKLLYVEHPTIPASSGTGVRMLLQDHLSIAQVSRPLKPKEHQKAEEHRFRIKHIPVAIDGIAFAINHNLNIPGLTLAQLKDIYTGKITNWQQVGGPNLKIVAYSKSPQVSGTAQFFVSQILHKEKFSPKVKLIVNTTSTLREVASNRGAIFYASAPEIIPQCTIKPLSIGRTSANLIKPYQGPLVKPEQCPTRRNQLNQKAFHNGSYPLTRNLYVIVKQNGLVDEQAGEAYAKLLLSEQGQKLIEKAGFVPIH